MRTLFVCALAATVVGCSCYAPPLASIDTCTLAGASGLACLDRSSLSQAIEPEPAASDAGLPAPKARSKIAARTEKPRSGHARHKTDPAMTTTSATPTANVEPAPTKVKPAANKLEPAVAKVEPAVKVEPAAAKVEPPASGRPAETSDQLIARAKTTIAAKLDDPRSAEFGEMKRAMRTNTFGKSVDTICGYVKGKKASGQSTGDRLFLYLVKDDEAYVVDGPATSIAATAYRNICYSMTTTKSATPTASVEPGATKIEPVANKLEPAAAKVEPAANEVEPAAAKVEPPASGRPAETSDQVIARAKTTIAAKLDDPRSAEFGEMKRAMRTNTLGKSVDTICGYVKGKKASGESTGDRPFLYLVKDDEAYVVDGPATSIAATAYRNICY
jgi:hypothetical protein